MAKRNLPKKWYDEKIKELYEGMNNMHLRMQNIEGAFLNYIEMKKDRKKFEKYLEKKSKEKDNGKD